MLRLLESPRDQRPVIFSRKSSPEASSTYCIIKMDGSESAVIKLNGKMSYPKEKVFYLASQKEKRQDVNVHSINSLPLLFLPLLSLVLVYVNIHVWISVLVLILESSLCVCVCVCVKPYNISNCHSSDGVYFTSWEKVSHCPGSCLAKYRLGCSASPRVSTSEVTPCLPEMVPFFVLFGWLFQS